jgi:excisionase family DNA binding protein
MSDPVLLTPAEAAELLRVSERTVQRLVAQGAIPIVPVGRLRRIRREALERWAADHERIGYPAANGEEAEAPRVGVALSAPFGRPLGRRRPGPRRPTALRLRPDQGRGAGEAG